MKLNLLADYDNKRKRGYQMTVDKIRYAPMIFGGGYGVRVVGEWKAPTWLSLSWFVKNEVDVNNRRTP